MRILTIVGRRALALCFILAVSLLSCQSRLIYHPRPYDRASLDFFERSGGRRLEFTTSQGQQVAFYLPPRGAVDAKPAYVWFVFGGNGSLSLDYVGLPWRWDERFGYVFVDYPSYGLCEGSPSPKSIEENALGAAARLRDMLAWSERDLSERAGVFGHSIGCAAGLLAADALHLRSAILCAPFTTLTDMARRLVGWPLCYLNLHRFDNLSRLESLSRKGAKACIFHGTEDAVIPVAMSQRLASHREHLVRLVVLPGADHNDVVTAAQDQAGAAMRELSGIK
ncbi:MAG: alpha/beta hydrolase [Roseimicrobium sp.]